jgi:hypothetical protein
MTPVRLQNTRAAKDESTRRRNEEPANLCPSAGAAVIRSTDGDRSASGASTATLAGRFGFGPAIQ